MKIEALNAADASPDRDGIKQLQVRLKGFRRVQNKNLLPILQIEFLEKVRHVASAPIESLPLG